MPIVRFQIKFSEAERALLRRRAAKDGMTEADHLRVCMVMDAMISGDPSAWKILGENLRVKLARRLRPGERLKAAVLGIR